MDGLGGKAELLEVVAALTAGHHGAAVASQQLALHPLAGGGAGLVALAAVADHHQGQVAALGLLQQHLVGAVGPAHAHHRLGSAAVEQGAPLAAQAGPGRIVLGVGRAVDGLQAIGQAAGRHEPGVLLRLRAGFHHGEGQVGGGLHKAGVVVRTHAMDGQQYPGQRAGQERGLGQGGCREIRPGAAGCAAAARHSGPR